MGDGGNERGLWTHSGSELAGQVPMPAPEARASIRPHPMTFWLSAGERTAVLRRLRQIGRPDASGGVRWRFSKEEALCRVLGVERSTPGVDDVEGGR